MAQRSPKTNVARWGVVGLTAALVCSLIFTVASSTLSAKRTSELVERGQADTLARAVRTELRGLDDRPDQEGLGEIVDTYGDLGLRCVAVMVRRGADPIEGGECRGVTRKRTRQGQLTHVGDRLRLTGRARAGGPGARGARLRGWVRSGHRPGPMLFAIEFDPLMGDQVRAEARRTFVVGLVTALALIVAAALLWWLLRQREAVERGLEHKRRLAALGEMSAVMAHEIRNPLASLKGHTQLLIELLAPRSRERAKAERVLGEALRLEQLTGDLLDFVRPAAITRAETPLDELVSEAVALVEHPQIVVKHGSAPAMWSLDRARFVQVLTNLLQNAAQACPDGTLWVSLASERAALVFRVRDQGPGLEPGQEEAIFEPFETTRVRGTGLGLAIARRIVEAHGGTISARNHPDGGAELCVRVPRP